MLRKAIHLSCYIIAGPNGAGKTTFATEYLPHYAKCVNFINPDLLARAYSPFDPDAGMLRAGRTVLERIAEFTKARTDFAFETALSGRSYVPLLRGVKKAGVLLHVSYLWIPSPELALLRIRDHVASGSIMSPSGMCGGGLAGRWAISLRYTARCWTRCISSITPPTLRHATVDLQG